MGKKLVIILLMISSLVFVFAEKHQFAEMNNFMSLEKIKAESGIDVTKVTSRIAGSAIYQNPMDYPSTVISRLNVTIGVGSLSFDAKFNYVGTGLGSQVFYSGLGDMSCGMTALVYQDTRNTVGFGGEFVLPIGDELISSETILFTPSLLYCFECTDASLFSIQSEYSVSLNEPNGTEIISILASKIKFAYFFNCGFYSEIEARPVYDFTAESFLPVVKLTNGYLLGSGFALNSFVEIPLTPNDFEDTGVSYQISFQKTMW